MNELKRQLCTIYSRVVGWYTPVQNYNPGKKSEYKDRKLFKIKNEKKD
jgi:ribonucleoside-triphosphate reductase (formate)